jgi:subtilisin-like proprotein convertase family protein
MKKILFLSIAMFLVFINVEAQDLWNKVPENRLSQKEKMDRASMPSKYELYSLDMTILKNRLSTSPRDSQNKKSTTIIPFPNSNGQMENYIIYEAPVMEDGLAVKFQDIKSYIGKGIDDPTSSIRFSVTMFGLHVMSLSGKSGIFYIDTYTKDLNNYIVYNRSALGGNTSFNCGITDMDQKFENDLLPKINNLRVSDSQFRNYRLAIACTIEYSAFHVAQAGVTGGTLAQKKAAVLAAMVVSMTRLNGLYERDMSLRMNLVANNDRIIFIDSDAFTNSPDMINEIQPIVDDVVNGIGAANYDIGHGFCTTDSGIAQLSSPCGGGKARGITGQINPVGDPFDIDYVAHEMGHQWGATHTQNNACNRSAVSSYETGSGSTIMGYAGICAPNVQSNSDVHFHAVSIQQMTTFVTGSTSCGVWTNNANTPPTTNAGLDYTIPRSTAFVLKGTATDVNNDALTYCWEQYNNEVSAQPPVSTATSGPNFRSKPPTTSPERYMPSLPSIIANNLTPAWEIVPSVARTMNFALTVRDNRAPNGGQTTRDDMVVTFANVGPFLVSTPNTAISWTVGTNQSVTWDVAGTTANGINASNVDIFLSTDGGLTYPILLASNVPNDGSETITVPNNPGTLNRIMVRGYKHIFFDISNANFTITAATSSFAVAFSGVAEEQNKNSCSDTVSYNISYSALSGFTGTTSFSAAGVPSGATINFSPTTMSSTSGVVVMTIGNLLAAPNGSFSIIVTATSGAVSKTVPFYLTSGGAITLATPVNSATGQAPSLILTWSPNLNATSYTVQVSTNNTFTAIVSTGSVTTPNYTISGLAESTQYYWRVLPVSPTCTTAYTAPFTFRTGATACATTSSTNVPVTISATGTPTATSTLNILSGGTISDVNVIMNVSHSYVSDLIISLISPTGTEVQLLNGQCTTNNNINATFDDSGSALSCAASSGTTTYTVSGTVIPNQALSGFNNQNSTGTWTLKISDGFNDDGGAINSWSLNICTVLPPLGINENQFTDFSLFPNPNNGEFTIKLNSDTSNDIKVDVFDMRGRQVYEKSYSNTGAFDQNINLNSIQSGIYLVSISDGSRKTVKRILVE